MTACIEPTSPQKEITEPNTIFCFPTDKSCRQIKTKDNYKYSCDEKYTLSVFVSCLGSRTDGRILQGVRSW